MTGTIGARKATMSFACGGSLGLSSFAYPLSLDPFLCSSQRACKCLVKTLCILFVKINWTKIHLPLHRIARKWCHAFFHAHILLFWPIWGPVIYFYNYCSDHEEASVEGWHHDNTFECLFEAGPQASNINSWLLSYKKTLFISGNLLFSWPFLFQTTLQWILISRGKLQLVFHCRSVSCHFNSGIGKRHYLNLDYLLLPKEWQNKEFQRDFSLIELILSKCSKQSVKDQT